MLNRTKDGKHSKSFEELLEKRLQQSKQFEEGLKSLNKLLDEFKAHDNKKTL